MTNTKPRLALLFNTLYFDFSYIGKLQLAPGLISAFYRMAFAFALLLPYMLFSKDLRCQRKNTSY
jgi:hypothetical protein